jgi:hypothetical protein
LGLGSLRQPSVALVKRYLVGNVMNENLLESLIGPPSCEIVHSGATAIGIATPAECGSLAGLPRFLRLLKETEHFCRWLQEKVAKIVQCGEKFLLIKIKKAICNGGLKFYCEAAALRRHIRAKSMNSPRCLQLRKEGVDLHSARRLLLHVKLFGGDSLTSWHEDE